MESAEAVFDELAGTSLISEVYVIISELAKSQAQQTGRAEVVSQDSTQNGLSQSQTDLSTNALQDSLTQTISLDSQSSSSLRAVDATASLSAEDLPARIYSIRQRILRAKQLVPKLPDVQRSIDEQQQEMRRLQQRISALQTRQIYLSQIAKQDQDVKMTGDQVTD